MSLLLHRGAAQAALQVIAAPADYEQIKRLLRAN